LACLKSNPNPFASLLASSCLASLRSPTGPGWLHEAKWNGYRVIARKDGERVRLWARMTSDYSNAFARIRNAVAALPVETAVLDGEASCCHLTIHTSNFDGLRSREGQAEAVLVGYGVMDLDGADGGPDHLEHGKLTCL